MRRPPRPRPSCAWLPVVLPPWLPPWLTGIGGGGAAEAVCSSKDAEWECGFDPAEPALHGRVRAGGVGLLPRTIGSASAAGGGGSGASLMSASPLIASTSPLSWNSPLAERCEPYESSGRTPCIWRADSEAGAQVEVA